MPSTRRTTKEQEHRLRAKPVGARAGGHGHCHHGRTPVPTKMAEGDQNPIEYTCPMHPRVRQRGPGHCPICGMALEPVLATAEQGESPELRDMTKRLWIRAALTVPVLAGLPLLRSKP